MRADAPARRAAHAKRADAACTTPYVAPTAGQTVQAFSTLDIAWNPACFSSNDVAIYIYPGPALTFLDVPNASGKYSTQIDPRPFNLTTRGTKPLQVQIGENGAPSWAASSGIGPTWTLSFDGNFPAAQAANTSASGPGLVRVDGGDSKAGLSGGAIAAAVVVPLLAVIAAVVGYILWQRSKSKSATKRWSAYVDHRLSIVSAGTGAGAGAGGPRASVMRESQAYQFPRPPPAIARSEMHERKPSAVSFSLPPGLGHKANGSSSGLSAIRRSAYARDSARGPLSPEQDSPAELDGETIASIGHEHHARNRSTDSLQRDSTFMQEPGLAVGTGADRLSRLDPAIAAQHAAMASDGADDAYVLADDDGGEEALDEAARQHRVSHPYVPKFQQRDSVFSPDSALAAYASSRKQALRADPTAAALGNPAGRGTNPYFAQPGFPPAAGRESVYSTQSGASAGGHIHFGQR